MSDSSITSAFINQYADDLRHAYQQFGSRLRSHVTVDPLAAEYGYFEYINPVEAYEKTGRSEEVKPVNTEHVRRRCFMRDYLVPDYIDNFDKKRLKVELVSGYVKNQAAALGRKFDDRILTQVIGTAYQGKSGGTAVSLPSAQTVAVDYQEGGGGSASNLTLGKIRKAIETLEADEALDPENEATACFVYTANQKHALVKLAEDLGVDTLTTQAIARNDDSVVFHGMKFVRVADSLLPKTSNNRSVIAFTKDAISVCENDNVNVEINYIPNKTSWLINASGSFDAARVRDNGVVEVLCDETKGV